MAGQNVHSDQTPYLQSGLPQSENRPPDGYSGGQLGYRFNFVDPTDGVAKRYQLIQADSVMPVVPAAGLVAHWLANTGYIVTTDVSVAGRGNRAGVLLNALTLGNIGCIQIGGKHDAVKFAAGTPDATGLIVIPTATDGEAQALAAGTAASYPPLGRTVGTATGAYAPVELECPGRE